MDDVEDAVTDRGVLTAPDEAWDRAVRAAQVLGPLAELPMIGFARADRAAAELSVSRRHLYVLLRRWREGDGVAETKPWPGFFARSLRRGHQPGC